MIISARVDCGVEMEVHLTLAAVTPWTLPRAARYG